MLPLIQSLQYFKDFPIAKFEIVNEKSLVEASSKIQFPLYLKVDTEKHKAKINAIFKCNNFQELQKNFNSLLKKFPNQRLIIQEDIKGIELVLGIQKDKTFGKILMLGIGGTLIEQIKDIKFRKIPITKQEIQNSIEKLNLYNSIESSLNEHNKQSFINLAYEIQKLNLKEADLNPIILTDKEAKIVDARIQT